VQVSIDTTKPEALKDAELAAATTLRAAPSIAIHAPKGNASAPFDLSRALRALGAWKPTSTKHLPTLRLFGMVIDQASMAALPPAVAVLECL
jgi:hypothetical protein